MDRVEPRSIWLRLRSASKRVLVPTWLILTFVLVVVAALRWVVVSHPLLYAVVPVAPVLLLGALVLLTIMALATSRRVMATTSALCALMLSVAVWPGGLPPWPICGGGLSESDLLIYSHNVSYESGDPLLVGRQIEEHSPDVVVLQEADQAFVEALQATTSEAYEFQVQSSSGETLSLTVLSRFPLTDVVDTSDEIEQKNPTLGVTIESPSTTLRITNVHLSAPRDGELIARRQQEFAQMQSSSFLEKGSDIVLGDFNSSKAHADFRSAIDGMQGSLVSSCNLGGTWSPLGRGPGLLDLDHAIVIEEGRVTADLQRLGYAGSDHRAALLHISTGD